MPDNAAHARDCHLMGVDADANMEEVEQAWRNLKAIYAEDSLATYGLLEDPERQSKLEKLEGAYGRIVHRFSRPAVQPPVLPTADREVPLDQLSAQEPIGQRLRELREVSGLTLRDVANRTKVSPMRLEQIEQEMFERLPEKVYLRGFVLEYAKVLGLPRPQEVAAMYLVRYNERVPA